MTYSPHTPASPEDIVYRFLRALAGQDLDQAAALLAPELRHSNVSLPTLKGGDFVGRVLRGVLGIALPHLRATLPAQPGA